MGIEHVEYAQLNDGLVRGSSDAVQDLGKHIRCRAVEFPKPDTCTHADGCGRQKDRSATDLHGGGYPKDVDKSKKEIVQRRTSIHVRQRHSSVTRYCGPRSTEGVLSVGEGTGVQSEQEELIVLLKTVPAQRISTRIGRLRYQDDVT